MREGVFGLIFLIKKPSFQSLETPILDNVIVLGQTPRESFIFKGDKSELTVEYYIQLLDIFSEQHEKKFMLVWWS